MIISEKGGEEKDCGGGWGGARASLNSAFILSSSWTAHVQNSLRIALLRTNNTSWIWRRCRRNWDVCSSTVEKKKKKISECQKLKELLKMEQGGHYPSSTLHCSRCCLDIDPSYLPSIDPKPIGIRARERRPKGSSCIRHMHASGKLGIIPYGNWHPQEQAHQKWKCVSHYKGSSS